MKAAITDISKLGIVLLLLAGCSAQKAYDGVINPARVARIVAQGVTLVEVNGHPIGVSVPEVEVAPGSNLVLLRIDRSNYNSPDAGNTYRLDLNAEPGADYIITGVRKICAYRRNKGAATPDTSAPAGCVQK